MKNLYQTILIVTLLISAQPAPGKDKSTILLDQSLLSAEKSDDDSSSDRVAAWLLYGMSRMSAMEERARSHRRYVPPNDYPAELRARSDLAIFWRDQREKGSEEKDTYLDTLVAIADAGFMEEYVISAFVSPGWTIKASDIAAFDFAGYTAWGDEHLKDFESVTLAGFEPKGTKIKNEPPGATLPDPYDFLPGQVSCAKVASTLNKAAKRWEKEAKSLPGTPIAAGSKQDLLALIDWIRKQPLDETASFTFVPIPVGYLIYIAGYCGVDTHDHKSSERWLKMAIKLLPMQMMPRLELAQTYIVRQRFEEADALVDEILNATEDRCNLGMAWRKRGFIRFEQGRLEDSRAAYKKSLEYDPYSRIALSELALLETEITRHGGTPDSYQPPPKQPQTTTECKPMTVLTLPGAA